MDRPKKAKTGSGGFQSFGLKKEVLKSVLKTGYVVPTPIQKKTIPLLLQGRDVVAMARTGSGKTAAFLIPLVHRLGQHSPNVGCRAMVLSPTRELAVQTVRFFKQLGRATTLRVTLVAGGFSLEDQFADLTTNPDVLVATPGRLLHILDEANLKLKCMEYVVLDEADRLFEMGFARTILDILRRCPDSRQLALFSATIPAAVAEFTGASLHDPAVVRLDTEIRISDSLQLAFLVVRPDQKYAALLYLLREVLKLGGGGARQDLTILFVQTRHHAEFLAMVLRAQGYSLSIVHGNMDQEARKINLDQFRAGTTPLMVVTDVAARGLDIPLLANVINFSFPAQPKLFVHRAGRAGRQGRVGYAYSLVSLDELPYVVDLHLFLGRPLWNTPDHPLVDDGDAAGAEAAHPPPPWGYLGALPEHLFQAEAEFLQRVVLEDCEVAAQHQTTVRAQQAYVKTRGLSSPQSVRRCKAILRQPLRPHPLLNIGAADTERQAMVEHLRTFRPQSNIFEAMGLPNVVLPVTRDGAGVLRKRGRSPPRAPPAKRLRTGVLGDDLLAALEGERLPRSNAERRKAFAQQLWTGQSTQEDADYFVPYQKPVDFVEMGYRIDKDATLDLHPDAAEDMSRNKQMFQWDKKKKKYVRSSFDEMKARGLKRRKNEAGVDANTATKQHLYSKWVQRTRLRIPEPGEAEEKGALAMGRDAQKRFHKFDKPEPEAPRGKSELKGLDTIRKDRKVRKRTQAEHLKGMERKKQKDAGQKSGRGRKGKARAHKFPSHNNGVSSKKTVPVGLGARQKGGPRKSAAKGGKGGKGGKGRAK